MPISTFPHEYKYGSETEKNQNYYFLPNTCNQRLPLFNVNQKQVPDLSTTIDQRNNKIKLLRGCPDLMVVRF